MSANGTKHPFWVEATYSNYVLMNILKFLQTFLKSFITFWVKIFIIFISVRVIKYLYMFIIYILMCIPFLYLHGLVCSKKVIVFYFYNILFPSKTINQGILSNFFFWKKIIIISDMFGMWYVKIQYISMESTCCSIVPLFVRTY